VGGVEALHGGKVGHLRLIVRVRVTEVDDRQHCFTGKFLGGQGDAGLRLKKVDERTREIRHRKASQCNEFVN